MSYGFCVSLTYSIITFANKDTLISSFPTCISSIFFNEFIDLAEMSRFLLNRYEERGQLCFVPDFSRNA